MAKKYGVDTDEFDKEAREAAKDYDKQVIAKEWSYEELQKRYGNLKAVTLKNFPHLWRGLEFALSVKTVINIKGNTPPFIGILLGPASSMKTLIIELFREYDLTTYTDYFSPKSLVSHNSAVSEEELKKIDLLPKIRNKLFLTPELSPLFGSKEDDLNQVIHILIRIADGHGYESDSGAKGHRGYSGEMMFTWVGAAVEIPYRVHKLLGNLGPKLYFLRLPRNEESEDDYFSKRTDNFKLKRDEVKQALYEYLQYFDLNPSIILEEEDEVTRLMWNGNGKCKKKKNNNEEKGAANSNDDYNALLPPKIEMYDDLHEENAERIIIRLALMLAHLRAIVPTWETYGTQGSVYGFPLPRIEDPTRAMTQMRNLAKGHALSQGRLFFTMDDIPFIIQVVMSTASTERVRIFELLLAYKGTLSTSRICESLDISKPTALRTMSELKVAGLVDMLHEDKYNAERRITLKSKFDWFLDKEFSDLKEKWETQTCKEKYPPRTYDKTSQTEGYSSDNNQNMEHEAEGNIHVRGGEISLHQYQNVKDSFIGQVLPPKCYYCSVNGFATIDEYERHGVKHHKDLPSYPGPADFRKHKIAPQGMPWERELERDCYFQFELEPKSPDFKEGQGNDL